MLFIKLRHILDYYRSKLLKKKLKSVYKEKKNTFINEISNIQLTNKWFLNNFEVFNYFLPKDKSKKFNYLEIGCFEGLSSYYVLSEYKFVNAFLIDLWDLPNPNSQILSENFNSIERVFDQNLKKFHFKKIKDDSVISMRKLLRQNQVFDFIYIDGSHNGEDILSDAIEAFKILKNGGFILSLFLFL